MENLMANDGAALTKMVRGQIGRRLIDATQLVIQVSGGVVHFGGVLRPLRGAPNSDMHLEMNNISTILRQKPGIKEVVWDVTLRL
jgi:hypothetical protein